MNDHAIFGIDLIKGLDRPSPLVPPAPPPVLVELDPVGRGLLRMVQGSLKQLRSGAVNHGRLIMQTPQMRRCEEEEALERSGFTAQ